MTKKRLNFTFRVTKNGNTIQRCQTHSRRRFANRIGTINWQNRPSSVYLRVSYGRNQCNLGCFCNFYNDGNYETKQDLLLALTAFTEARSLPEMSRG